MENLEQLRKYFKISNAIFNSVNNIQLALNGYINTNKMQQLHKIALEEIEKENPDFKIIDSLLLEMELLSKSIN